MTTNDLVVYVLVALALTATFIVAVGYVRDLRKEDAAKIAADEALDQLRVVASVANLIDFNRKEIEQFSLQARGRARWAFSASLAAMFVGLLFFGVGVYYTIGSPEQDTVGKVLATVLSALGGTLLSYISGTFMETYKQTAQQLDLYFHQSVATSHLLRAERLIHGLRDRDEQESVVKRMIEEALAAAACERGFPGSRFAAQR
jgi:hypothetical protein